MHFYRAANGNKREASRLYGSAFPIGGGLKRYETVCFLASGRMQVIQERPERQFWNGKFWIRWLISQVQAHELRDVSLVCCNPWHGVCERWKAASIPLGPVTECGAFNCNFSTTVILANDIAATVLSTDESTFARDRAWNTHNEQVWTNVNPHVHQRRFCINVWTEIIGDNLIGAYLPPEYLDGEKYFTLL